MGLSTSQIQKVPLNPSSLILVSVFRLEQRNKVLLGEVTGLRSTLEQQRRWVSVAEIKMRNVERARTDADRRNATLQREMEQFFETFGELSAEARKTSRIVQSF